MEAMETVLAPAPARHYPVQGESEIARFEWCRPGEAMIGGFSLGSEAAK